MAKKAKASHLKKKNKSSKTEADMSAASIEEVSAPAPATEDIESVTQSAESSDARKNDRAKGAEERTVHLDFYGSEILRQRVPQAFELAEAVAEEWKKDGNFQKLPLNHPFAQLVAAVSLQGAKKIEKKLEERGVFSMAKMGLEYAKTRWPFKDAKSL